MQRRQSLFACVILCMAVVLGVTTAVAQVNTATLTGLVTDPQGLAVRGAKVTATSLATGAERTATVDEGGHYIILGLVPGEYKLRVESGTSFAPYENPSVQVTVGQEAILNVRLELGTQTQVVTVTTESLPIETTRSESAQTVEERQIDNLPINGRNYINFTLTNSQTTRDVSPTIGPAPNSGLNLSGARARSNMVSVDGADAGDNSVNGIRATVSQEAVQEFQMILSNYNAEYGRATGGVVNIVTKSGGNDFHGDVFGYLRNKAFQARNAFSGDIDAEGNLVPVKQAYTRTQSGLTFGGALKKDKTFYFFSYEYTQREETGFSSIGIGNYGLESVNLPVPGVPGGVLPVQLTASQASAVNSLLTSGVPALEALGVNYGVLMGSASSVATNRLDYGVLAAGLTHGALNPGPGPQFPVPVACPASQTVNLVTCAAFGEGIAPLPASFVGLNSIRGNFPATEKTSLWSARLDQRWDNHNTSFLRVGVSPSLVTGIQSTSQNQVFGQNAGSRTGVNQSRDFNVTFQHDTILSDSAFNEFRMQVARRGIHFGYSDLSGGSDIGVNIPGYAYFGREPYSTVDRIERRFEFTDNTTLTRGRHTFKIGEDINIIQLRSKKQQIFQLDFGGDVNFGGLPADTFGLPDCLGGT
ncbi:MAG: carboxypeptidase regulatory-like domain-containing protein, partial [Candidatus Acidiferrum sp.]